MVSGDTNKICSKAARRVQQEGGGHGRFVYVKNLSRLQALRSTAVNRGVSKCSQLCTTLHRHEHCVCHCFLFFNPNTSLRPLTLWQLRILIQSTVYFYSSCTSTACYLVGRAFSLPSTRWAPLIQADFIHRCSSPHSLSNTRSLPLLLVSYTHLDRGTAGESVRDAEVGRVVRRTLDTRRGGEVDPLLRKHLPCSTMLDFLQAHAI